MRPKARGLDQHGGPGGWLEESDLAGVILYVNARLGKVSLKFNVFKA